MKLSARNNDMKKSRRDTVKSALSVVVLTTLVAGCASKGGSEEGFEQAFAEPEPAAEAAQVVEEAPAQVESAAVEAKQEAVAAAEPVVEVQEEPEPVVEVAPEPEPVVEVKQEVAKTVEEVKTVEPVKPEPVKAVAPEPVKKPEPKPVNADELVANLAPKAAPKPAKGGKRISKKDLPARFELWEVKKGSALLDKDVVITTPTWQMGEPGYNSQIWVTVMDDKVMVYSSSDFIKKSAGVKINGGALIRFSKVIDNNIGVLEGDYLGKLSGGGKMEVLMGFFPGKKPTSKTYKSEVSLDGLGDAIYHYSYLK